MPQETGTVTEVGVGNIQFYIPSEISSHSDCTFDPGDEFEVRTIAGVGLLLLETETTPTLDDLADVLDTDEQTPDRPTADQ